MKTSSTAATTTSDGAVKLLQAELKDLKEALDIKDLVIEAQHKELVRLNTLLKQLEE